MILRDLLQLVLFIGLLAALSPLLGRYVHQVFSGRRTFLHPVLGPVERGVYSLSGIHPDENQTWSRYAVSLIGFSLAGFLLTFGVLLFQDKLPLNPQGFPGLSWDLALNTAVSFLTNTNWQSYGGETTMSHFSQMVALTYQNFVSAAVGIAVCAAVVRGIARNESSSIGNFWSDLVRITLYVLLPLSIIGALIMLWQGMVQNFDAGVTATTLEGGKQFIATGPVASQIAIKLLGTNGGGFFGVNSAHPFENPNALSNLFEMISLLLIPVAIAYMLCAKSWGGRFLGLLSAGVGCVAIAMTYSRASWVGLAFAAVIFVLLWNRKLIPLGIFAALVILAALPDTVFNRVLTIFNTEDSSTTSRFPLYKAAGELLLQRPILGAGLGSDAVRQAVSDLNLFHGKDYFVHCHDIYLQVWCETGLVGLISFVGGILWTFKQGCRAVVRNTCGPVARMAIIGSAAAILGTMLCGVADYIWNYPRVMLIFWFVCSLTLAGIRLAAQGEAEEEPVPAKGESL